MKTFNGTGPHIDPRGIPVATIPTVGLSATGDRPVAWQSRQIFPHLELHLSRLYFTDLSIEDTVAYVGALKTRYTTAALLPLSIYTVISTQKTIILVQSALPLANPRWLVAITF